MKLALKAIKSSNLESLNKALLQIEDVNLTTPQLLFLAVEEKFIEGIKVLLSKGADPTLLNADGIAPIHIAAQNTEIFYLLIDNGANVATPDSHLKTPIFYAVDVNNYVVVKKISNQEGIVTHRCNDERISLHDASERGFNEIAIELLQNGANVNAQNWNNVTPLHLACKYGRFDMVELLLQNGAAIDAQDVEGKTPLHYAAKNDYGDISMYLVTCGCDHTIRDNDGNKASDLAPNPLKKELIDFIINHLMTNTRGLLEASGSNMGICVFCQKEKAKYIFNPCQCVSLCTSCYEEAKTRIKFCPMCRRTLTSVQEIELD